MSHKKTNIQNKEYGLLPLQWADIKTVVEKSRLSRSTVLRIIGNPANGVRSFLFRSNPTHEHGKRLIYWPSLVAYISRQAEAAQEAAAELEKSLQ